MNDFYNKRAGVGTLLQRMFGPPYTLLLTSRLLFNQTKQKVAVLILIIQINVHLISEQNILF